MTVSLLQPMQDIHGRPCRPASIVHLRSALNGLHLGLFTFDYALCIQFMNEQLRIVLDLSDDAAGAGSDLQTFIESSPILASTAVQQVLAACHDAVLTRRLKLLEISSNEKGIFYFSIRIEPLPDQTFLATIVDMTAQRVAEARAVEEAMCDPLTGLPNRTLFEDRVVAALDRNASEGVDGPAVMVIDLDRFKNVNDTLGHLTGDGLLRLVSKRLQGMMRQTDIIARFGGDEFAALISPAPDLQSVSLLASRIVDVLSRPYLVDGHLVNIGASVGVAVAPLHGSTYAILLRSADLALYDAKSRGRGTSSLFQPTMDVRAAARRQNENDLRKALALREFSLHFQPQVDLQRNVIVGFEALLRWHHPERGLISPMEFIPLAEEIGLIVPLGEWVLSQACLAASCWPSDISIAVNVSPCQFGDTDRLIDAVAEALVAADMPGSRLELEITESVLLQDADRVLDALHRLRAMGVHVAMDDFGTGYSSLSQLHSFPFDKIKIDRSFVKDRADDRGQDAVIRAIAALGGSLGMATIAEGVETPEQLARIREGGCKIVQGYLFSRPIPVEQVDLMIARHNSKKH